METNTTAIQDVTDKAPPPAPPPPPRAAGSPAKMTRPVNPDDYYPPGSIRREEQGSPVVQACVGPNGRLLRDPVVTDTSGFPDLDGAAVKVAKATKYAARHGSRLARCRSRASSSRSSSSLRTTSHLCQRGGATAALNFVIEEIMENAAAVTAPC